MQSRIAFHLRYFEAEGGVLENLDLSLVRTIAMIELYFREKYLESVRLPRFPMNLLVHETLSILSQKGCLYPHRLAEELLELAIFRHISQDELKQVLRAMMEKDYIRLYEDGAVGPPDSPHPDLRCRSPVPASASSRSAPDLLFASSEVPLPL